MRKRYVSSLACLGFAATSLVGLGTASAATVGPLVRVSTGDPFAGCTADKVGKQIGTNYPATEIEPWVAVDPADPNRLLVGHQQDRWTNGGSRGLVGELSDDGGRSWKRVIPGRVTQCEGGPWTRASDPWVDFSTTGIAYFSHLTLGPALANGNNVNSAQVVTRSLDGGRTWQAPVTVIRDNTQHILNDKNSITADPTRPSYAYVVWDRLTGLLTEEGEGGGPVAGSGAPEYDGVVIATEHLRAARAGHGLLQQKGAASAAAVESRGPTWLSRTTDSGKTWEKARIIYDPGQDIQTIGNQVVVTPSGTVVDVFNEINQDNGAMRLRLVRSFDAGKSFEKKPHDIAAQSFSYTGVVTPNKDYTKQYSVRDAAILFDVAVDPKDGTLYVVWQDTRFSSVDEVAFTRSRDGGLTWSDPIRVNQTPQNLGVAKLRSQAFIPQVAVAADGTVVAFYYDFRNDNDSNNTFVATDAWVSFCRASVSDCTNAGSWKNEIRLTNKSFNMLDAPVAGGLFLGDYMGLTRAADSVVAAFGVTDGNNKTSLYSRKIDFGSKAEIASAAGQ